MSSFILAVCFIIAIVQCPWYAISRVNVFTEAACACKKCVRARDNHKFGAKKKKILRKWVLVRSPMRFTRCERNKKLPLERQTTVKMRSARERRTRNKWLLFMKTLFFAFNILIQPVRVHFAIHLAYFGVARSSRTVPSQWFISFFSSLHCRLRFLSSSLVLLILVLIKIFRQKKRIR